MSIKPLENRLVAVLERWRRWAAIAFCVGIVAIAAVSLGAGKATDYPADAIQIEVTTFGGTKTVLAKQVTEPASKMGVLIVRYVGYYDNVWHTAGGMGVWIDVPTGPPLPGIAKD